MSLGKKKSSRIAHLKTCSKKHGVIKDKTPNPTQKKQQPQKKRKINRTTVMDVSPAFKSTVNPSDYTKSYTANSKITSLLKRIEDKTPDEQNISINLSN